MLGGLHKSDLIVLAGRPSMGKTALATNIAFNIASGDRDELDNVVPREDRTVGFFSLEMSTEQLATRIVAEAAQLPSDKIRKGELNASDFEKLVVASQKIQSAPLFIDDTPALTVSALRTRARRLRTGWYRCWLPRCRTARKHRRALCEGHLPVGGGRAQGP